MKIPNGNVDVMAGTGFRAGVPVSLVQLIVSGGEAVSAADGEPGVVLRMRPADARKIGLDMIGASFATVADSEMRLIAQQKGLDGDALIRALRVRLEKELP